MRRAFTIGYEHGSNKPVLLSGPEKPVQIHIGEYKAIKGESHAVFARIEIWESDSGITKSRDFKAMEDSAKEEPKTEAQTASKKRK